MLRGLADSRWGLAEYGLSGREAILANRSPGFFLLSAGASGVSQGVEKHCRIISERVANESYPKSALACVKVGREIK